MFTKKAFTITIGNESSLLSLNHGTHVKNKVLVPSLSREGKIQLLKIFKQNKGVPVYILLDNAEQTYTNKSYPSINRLDLKQIINRHLQQEFQSISNSEELVYNYMTYKNKKMKKWECMYVSSVYFDAMDQWIDFLLQEVSNPLLGIYMLPIETVSLIKKLHLAQNQIENKKAKKNEDENENKNENKDNDNSNKITLLIIQNKVSGIRQVVFLNEKIIFTRLTKYEYEDKNFIVDFEQDIFRTNEYLKRILPNLKMEDVEIINILPRFVIEKISHIKNHEINFTNYTPREAAEKIGYNKLIPKNSQFADILVSSVFVNSNKILKSITKKIKSLWILDTLSKISVGISFSLLLVVIFYSIFIQIEQSGNSKQINRLIKTKLMEEQNLVKIKEQVIGEEAPKDNGVLLGIDEIIAFGRLDESIEKNKAKPLDFFKILEFITSKSVTVHNFRFVNEFTIQSTKDNFSFTIIGKIKNDTGDVESLFKIYDDLILTTTNKFKEYRITSSDLPQDLDFSKKYYEVSFTLIIRSQK